MNSLEGKVALITGAKGALGSLVTQMFLAAGATVAGVSRSIQASDFPHPRFSALAAELSSFDAARTTADEVVRRFGHVDALVHTVGGFTGGQSVADTDDAIIDQMLNANYRSAFHIARAVLPHMRSQGRGRILAVASRQAVEPGPMVGAYSASKAALLSLVRTIGLENGDRNITANAVLPGMMDTPKNRAAMPDADTSQWVHPSQVASLLVYLACDDASDITGAAIPVYGRA
jgi:NAD(P)-dependent dehydrogenase (short-subunit alcohol dehydrogenase family)